MVKSYEFWITIFYFDDFKVTDLLNGYSSLELMISQLAITVNITNLCN